MQKSDFVGRMRENFRQEIRILGTLRHPNITTIIGAGSALSLLLASL